MVHALVVLLAFALCVQVACSTPTLSPTPSPTSTPTLIPTLLPTPLPSCQPSLQPTLYPTMAPSLDPSFPPTLTPTLVPTGMPSPIPTGTPVTTVRLGYFMEPQPFETACSRGWFEHRNNLTSVACFVQSSGNLVVSNLDSGHLDMAVLGSAGHAAAVARGVDITGVYVAHRKFQSQGLVAVASILEPRDLAGKTIATVQDSTADYQLQFIQSVLRIRVNIVYMQLGDITAAWNAGSIDGAFCWGWPYLHIQRHGGRVVLSAGAVGDLGRDTYGTIVVRRAFARDYPWIVEWIVAIMALLDESWLTREQTSHWEGTSKSGFIASVADASYANATGRRSDSSTRAAVLTELKGFQFYESSKQLSMLGYRPNNATDGFLPGPRTASVAGDLWSAAQFLVKVKSLARPLPAGLQLPEPYVRATREGVFTRGINGSFLHGGLDGCGVGCAKSHIGQDLDFDVPTLTSLLARPDGERARPLVPKIAASTCQNLSFVGTGAWQLFRSSVGSHQPALADDKGNFSDGTYNEGWLDRRSYSDSLTCSWVVSSNKTDGVVEVRFTRFKVWAGDFVRIFQVNATNDFGRSMLLGQVHGTDLTLPPFRAKRAMLVTFETDSNTEECYNKHIGDGIDAVYDTTDTKRCSTFRDCSGEACGSDGICQCSGGRGGGDCSHDHCLGTALLKKNEGNVSSARRALERGHYYPNNALCRFVVEPQLATARYVRFDFQYDLEETHDYVSVRSGAGSFNGGAAIETFVNLTGFPSGGRGAVEKVTVPLGTDFRASVEFATDAQGRRGGFVATFSSHHHVCVAQTDCSGHGKCRNYECECDDGWGGLACGSPRCVATKALPTGRTGQIISQPAGHALAFLTDCSWSVNHSFTVHTNTTNFTSREPTPVPTATKPPTPLAPTMSPSKTDPPSNPPTLIPTMGEESRLPTSTPTSLPTRAPDLLTGVRIFFHRFDLEPASDTGFTDRVEIYRNGVSNMTLRNNIGNCGSDPDCVSACPRDVGCRCSNGTCVPRVVHLSDPTSVGVRIVTDRNDRGLQRLGINATYIAIESCLTSFPKRPPSKDGCRRAGGVCVHGYCFNTAEVGPRSRAFSCDCTPDYFCPAGQFFSYNGTERKCANCPLGTFAASSGVRFRCDRCPPGKVRTGRMKDRTTCVACGMSSYKPGNRSVGDDQWGCIACPEGTERYADASDAASLLGTKASDCECSEGFYSSEGKRGEVCTPCPHGSICYGRSWRPIPLGGFWVDSSKAAYQGTIKRCLHRHSCPSPSNELVGLCFESYEVESTNCSRLLAQCSLDESGDNDDDDGGKEDNCLCGEGSKGFLCGVCMRGYFREDRTCRSCMSAWVGGSRMIWVYILVSTVISIILAARQFCSHTIHYYKRELASLLFDEGRFKVVFAMWQIIGLAGSATGVDAPEPFKSLMGGFFSLAALDSFPVPCIFGWWFTYYHSLLFATLLPLLVCLVLVLCTIIAVKNYNHLHHSGHGCVILMFRSGHRFVVDFARLRNAHGSGHRKIYSIFMLLWVCLPPITLVLIRTFDVVQYGEHYSYLTADLRLGLRTPLNDNGSSPWGHSALFTALMVLVYPIGLPCLWITILSRYRSQINTWDRRGHVSHFLRPFGFMFRCFRPEDPNGQLLDSEGVEVKDTSARFQLFEDVIDFGRRIFLTTVVAMCSKKSHARALFGFCSSIISLVIFRERLPYQTPHTNILGAVATFQISLHYFLLFLTGTKRELGLLKNMLPDWSLGCMFCFVNITTFVYAIYLHMEELKVRLEHEHCRRQVHKFSAQLQNVVSVKHAFSARDRRAVVGTIEQPEVLGKHPSEMGENEFQKYLKAKQKAHSHQLRVFMAHAGINHLSEIMVRWYVKSPKADDSDDDSDDRGGALREEGTEDYIWVEDDATNDVLESRYQMVHSGFPFAPGDEWVDIDEGGKAMKSSGSIIDRALGRSGAHFRVNVQHMKHVSVLTGHVRVVKRVEHKMFQGFRENKGDEEESDEGESEEGMYKHGTRLEGPITYPFKLESRLNPATLTLPLDLWLNKRNEPILLLEEGALVQIHKEHVSKATLHDCSSVDEFLERAGLGYLGRSMCDYGVETLQDLFEDDFLSDADLRNELLLTSSEIVRLRRFMGAALLPSQAKSGWCYGTIIFDKEVNSVFEKLKQKDKTNQLEDADERGDPERTPRKAGPFVETALKRPSAIRRASAAVKGMWTRGPQPGNEEMKSDSDQNEFSSNLKQGKVHSVMDASKGGALKKGRYSQIFDAKASTANAVQRNKIPPVNVTSEYAIQASHSSQDEDVVGDSVVSGWFHIGFTGRPSPMQLLALQNHFGGKHSVKHLHRPKSWVSAPSKTTIQLVNLPTTTPIATRIAIHFNETWVGPDTSPLRKHHIKSIERIENFTLWQTYAMKRHALIQRATDQEGMGKDNPRLQVANRRDSYEHIWLFWACPTPDHFTKISTQGINRFTCGRNVMKNGKGVSFDTKMWCTNDRAVADSKDVKRVVFCRVLVGEPEVGFNGQTHPSVRQVSGEHVPFDSTTDSSEPNERLKYVIFNDAQVYPEYLVEYHDIDTTDKSKRSSTAIIDSIRKMYNSKTSSKMELKLLVMQCFAAWSKYIYMGESDEEAEREKEEKEERREQRKEEEAAAAAARVEEPRLLVARFLAAYTLGEFADNIINEFGIDTIEDLFDESHLSDEELEDDIGMSAVQITIFRQAVRNNQEGGGNEPQGKGGMGGAGTVGPVPTMMEEEDAEKDDGVSEATAAAGGSENGLGDGDAVQGPES